MTGHIVVQYLLCEPPLLMYTSLFSQDLLCVQQWLAAVRRYLASERLYLASERLYLASGRQFVHYDYRFQSLVGAECYLL